MMTDYYVFFTILAMAFVTYLTRVTGYLLLHNRVLNPRLVKLLDAMPGCVLIAVIAPAFATSSIANLLALIITFILACRFSLLITVVFSILATALLRYLIP